MSTQPAGGDTPSFTTSLGGESVIEVGGKRRGKKGAGRKESIGTEKKAKA